MRTIFLRTSAAVLLSAAVASCAATQVTPAEPGIRIEPVQGAPGTEVLVTAWGLPSSSPVEIGFGPPASEYDVIQRTRSDEGGAVETRVHVPDRAEPGREYVFVAAEADGGPGRVKVVSERFRVVAP